MRALLYVLLCATLCAIPVRADAPKPADGAPLKTSSAYRVNGLVLWLAADSGVTLGAATDPFCGWEGDIAETLVYNHALTPAEMQQVWFFLSGKYGLHALPVTSGINVVTPKP